jgi:Zn-dependent protease
MPDAPRRRGPWDSAPEEAASAAVAPDPRAEPGPRAEIVDRGQNPAWALISTLLLAGLIWVLMGHWVFAVAGVFGLLVHEYGHVLAMNRLGMGPARIYIVPFLGGMAKAQRGPKTEWHGVLTALAGPAFGILATLPFVGLWLATGEQYWLMGAFFIAAINLLNLLPAPPLDGSRALGPVLARIDPMVEKAALIAIGVAVIWWGLSTGRFILAAFLAIAVVGHLRQGVWRSGEGPLSWGEAGRSLGLFLLTGLVCGAAAVGALIPLGDGTIMGALNEAGGYIGLESRRG